MATKHDLDSWVLEALRGLGGSGPIPDVCWRIWEKHSRELMTSGDLFVTWGYDVRWAAQRLADKGVIRSRHASPKGVWELA
jgi:hypothetical protein